MYKIRFNTKDFSSKNRRDWNTQLYNDFAVVVNGMEFDCNNKEEALNRLHFIAGNKVGEFKDDFILLENERYSQQHMYLRLPGFCQGYVDLEKVMKYVDEDGFYKIKWNSFYDARQGRFFKGCYVEIVKMDS